MGAMKSFDKLELLVENASVHRSNFFSALNKSSHLILELGAEDLLSAVIDDIYQISEWWP